MSLQRETWKNLGWVGGLQATLSLLQAVTNIVLARLLFPEDFGVIALAQAFIYFVQRFQDFGLGTAIVQKQGEVRDLLYTANLFRSVIAVCLVAVCFFLGPVWADFYGHHGVGSVIRILAITFLLNSAVFIPRTLLRKSMAFRKLFAVESTGAVVNAATKLVLAFSGFGFWSIAIGGLAGQLIVTIGCHLAHPYPFRFRFRAAAAGELFRFARFLVLAGLIQFMNTNLDNMTVGKVLGLAALGFFDIAYRWGTWLTAQLGLVVRRVFLPTLSAIQDDLPRLRAAYLKSNEILTAMAAPLFLGLSAVAPEFIATLLGAKWAPAATALRIAAICGLFRTLAEIPQTLLVSIAKTRWPAISAGATLAVTAVAIVPLTIWLGIEGAAVAIGLAAAAGLAVTLTAVFRETGLSPRAWFGSVLPSLSSAAIMAVAVWLEGRSLAVESPAVRLLLLVAGGAVVYTGLLCIFSRRTPAAWFRYAWPRR
ncbi:MAG: lipopolysaccharide biosynthesis protein [Planctomycetota bacterium]